MIANTNQNKAERATFAGGCFWCMEPPFEKLDGVIDVVSGYMGGTGENPTYKDYAQKGHIEVVQITYNPEKISYDELLDVFWRQIDPTDAHGQFVDRGKQYRTAIFYHNDEQKNKAIASKKEIEKSGIFSKPIVTEILSATTFYKAEDYHQDFYKNHPWRYKWYRLNSGRDIFLKKVWSVFLRQAQDERGFGATKQQATSDKPASKKPSKKNNSQFTKPSDEELRKILTPLQYKVTQQNGTERPYANEYWNNTKPGIYVDIVSGEPLFSSLDKYESNTGWPSFTKPLEPDNIIQKEDRRWFGTYTEVRSKHADSHLGHVFKDGPPPTGLRYCINSAALRFIPVQELEEKGYGKYKKLFEE